MAQFGSITNAQRFKLFEIQRAQRTLAENKAKAQEFAQKAETYAASAIEYFNEISGKVTEENRTQVENIVRLAKNAKNDAEKAATAARSAVETGDITTAEANANIAKDKLTAIQNYVLQVNWLLNEENNYGITEEQWAILSGEDSNENEYNIVERDENGIKSKVYTDKETGKLIKTEYYDENGNISKSVYYFESADNKHLEITKNAEGKITEAKEYTDEQNSTTTYYNADGTVNYKKENSPNEEKTTYYTADGNTCVVQQTITEGGNTETKVEFGNKTIVPTGDEISVNVGTDVITIKTGVLTETYSFDGELINERYEFGNYTKTITHNGDDTTTTFTDKNGILFTQAQWDYLSNNGISMNFVDNKFSYTKNIQTASTEENQDTDNTQSAEGTQSAEESTNVPTKDITVKQEGDYIVITEKDDNGTTSTTYIDVDGNVAKIVVVTDENETTTTFNEDGTKTETIVSDEGNKKQIIEYNTKGKQESTTIIEISGKNITETKKDASGNTIYTKITTTDSIGTEEREYDENNYITKHTYKDLDGNITKEILYNQGENKDQAIEIIYENGERTTGTVIDNNTKEVLKTIDYKKERQVENVKDIINNFKNGEIKTINDLITKLQSLELTEDDYNYTQENGVFTLTVNIGTPSIEYTNESVKTAKELYMDYNSWEEFCESIEELEGIYDINNYNIDSNSGIAFISFYFNGENYSFNKKKEAEKEEDVPVNTNNDDQGDDDKPKEIAIG